MRARILYGLLATVALAAGPSLVHAQMFNSIGGNQATPSGPKVTPPPALPGAASNAGNAAPSVRPPTDMDPSDALFDAINRGDIATARDAISRGADLRGHNILGMTPMELSIDLGRNDISFLLLSMRGGDDGRNRQPPPATTAATKSPPSRQARQVSAHPPPVTAAKVPASAQQPVPSQTARLFSGDGGAPVPNAGFLGFDSGRR
jgi:hypothetical protein